MTPDRVPPPPPRYRALLRNVGRVPEVFRCLRVSPDWASHILTYVGLARPTFPRDFRTRSGDTLSLESFTDLVTAWIIYCRREYTVLSSDRVIVDAGANIGAFSLYAARRAPLAKIVALEPFPETRRLLTKTVAANKLADRVEIRDWALAGDDSRRMMDLGTGDEPSQSRGMFPAGAQDGVAVNAVSLATFLRRENLTKVDLLKMDIEGSEHEVFAGADNETLRHFARISLEYHPNKPWARLFARLEAAGFRLRRDLPAGPDSGVAELELGI
jgi:FkbM family methyltransferase